MVCLYKIVSLFLFFKIKLKRKKNSLWNAVKYETLRLLQHLSLVSIKFIYVVYSDSTWPKY